MLGLKTHTATPTHHNQQQHSSHSSLRLVIRRFQTIIFLDNGKLTAEECSSWPGIVAAKNYLFQREVIINPEAVKIFLFSVLSLPNSVPASEIANFLNPRPKMPALILNLNSKSNTENISRNILSLAILHPGMSQGRWFSVGLLLGRVSINSDYKSRQAAANESAPLVQSWRLDQWGVAEIYSKSQLVEVDSQTTCPAGL